MSEILLSVSVLVIAFAILLQILLLCVLLWSMDGIEVTINVKESSLDLDAMEQLGEEAIELNRREQDEEQDEKNASIGASKTPSDMPVREALDR